MTKQTATLRDGTARVAGRGGVERGRPGDLWRGLYYHKVEGDLFDTLFALEETESRRPRGHALVCKALGVDLDGDADEAARVTLNYFGVTSTRIAVVELLNGAKQWQFPDEDGDGVDALILPVGGLCNRAAMAGCLSLLGSHDVAGEATADHVSDLIAIPVDGSAMLSFNGTTSAVGSFFVSDGVLRLAADGLSWLKAHVARARRMARDQKLGEEYTVARKLAFPDHYATLVLDVRAFCWSLEKNPAIATFGAHTIRCESADDAGYIVRELRRREPLPKINVVGPT